VGARARHACAAFLGRRKELAQAKPPGVQGIMQPQHASVVARNGGVLIGLGGSTEARHLRLCGSRFILRRPGSAAGLKVAFAGQGRLRD
jgi:hypothetical protein